ncbi:TVP38/TMEM64 family protein [Pseudochryseolinea flava]|uniref:TVP38/TMEM64 family membrane protein n=1 Tax=Pseudochryseolinea flava TaxID=2059302 RepID=A0A364Y5K1_9BACT|nr:VTT domain-containing protein [Pseudochryseolinea flava]RAW02112.1 TVP38/TMEM64 family protein [Pseudochryseolinea flava]
MKNSSTSNDGGRKNPGKNWFLISMLSVLTIAVGCYFIIPDFKDGVNDVFAVLTSDDQDEIQRWVKKFGILGPVVLIVAMAFQMFLLIVPNILLFAIAIVCYGPIWGALICLIGVFCSSSLGYFIGKKLGPRAIDRFVSQRIQNRIQVFVERYGAKAVAIFRLSTISADSLGFVAGILEMSYKKYIIATMCGVTPLIIMIAIYGKNGNVETALLWIAGISLVCLVVYYVLDKKRRNAAFADEDQEHATSNINHIKS